MKGGCKRRQKKKKVLVSHTLIAIDTQEKREEDVWKDANRIL